MPNENDANRRDTERKARTGRDGTTVTSSERHSHWVVAVLGTAQVVLGLLLSLAGFTGSLLALGLGVAMVAVGAFVIAAALRAALPESRRQDQ